MQKLLNNRMDWTSTDSRQQVVSGWVHSIAARAPPDQLERYLAAANEFRMPYWDWAQGTTTGPVPDFFMTPTLTVTDIDQSQVLIYNPLYSYRFKPIPEQFDEKVCSCSL
jgi:tyrosinase